jgi:hypothetical protein
MPARASRFVSDVFSGELWERAPAPGLRPHVLGYCGYREWGSAGFRRLETPSDEVHVVLSFGPRIRANGEEIESFVAAPDVEHAVVESPVSSTASSCGSRRSAPTSSSASRWTSWPAARSSSRTSGATPA